MFHMKHSNNIKNTIRINHVFHIIHVENKERLLSGKRLSRQRRTNYREGEEGDNS